MNGFFKGTSDPIRRYDHIAGKYDALALFCEPQVSFLKKAMEDAGCSFYRSLKLLDLGCGTGLSSVGFVSSGVAVYGVDASRNMLLESVKKGIIPSVGNLNINLPFKDESFDFVVSSGVFCLLSSLSLPLKEASRVLKKKGVFAFSVEDVSSADDSMVRRSNMSIYRHSLRSIFDILQKASFSVLEIRRFLGYQLCSFNTGSFNFSLIICIKNE